MNNVMVSFIEHAVVYLVGSQLEQRIIWKVREIGPSETEGDGSQ
jgi:hypothetical protein